MRRVLVPLDGTDMAEAILPDARRLAGANGELILINDATIIPYYWLTYPHEQEQAIRQSRQYLDELAEKLRDESVKVQEETTVLGDAARAIDEAATMFQADMVAVATHARGALGRLFRGSIAWRALANSSVPVLLRHIKQDNLTPYQPLERRILVPLDGSTLAEKALPLAQELAREWGAEIWLVQVVFTMATPPGKAVLHMGETPHEDIEPAKREAEAYLREVGARLKGDGHTHVLLGTPIDDLAAAAEAWLISDIVMASHGRTGLARVILGSVADALIHRLDLPIIVVPALSQETSSRSGEEAATRASRPRPGRAPEGAPGQSRPRQR